MSLLNDLNFFEVEAFQFFSGNGQPIRPLPAGLLFYQNVALGISICGQEVAQALTDLFRLFFNQLDTVELWNKSVSCTRYKNIRNFNFNDKRVTNLCLGRIMFSCPLRVNRISVFRNPTGSDWRF